uniref:NADH-ubiquinone oxidoreductase chain 4L n=1 Tax=Boreus elegans TaxID=948611 RepID=E9NQ68_BOREL|nr:NADH dehydrogenase subunit 4L [Boreus elegans]
MMMLIYWLMPIIFIISGMWSFAFKRKHLLITLLSLEYIILSLFLLLFIYLNIYDNEIFFSMMFLCFSVCEGVMGLSILVSMIRAYGNDYFQSFNILQC